MSSHTLIYTFYQNSPVRIDFLFCSLIFIDLDRLIDGPQRQKLRIFTVDYGRSFEVETDGVRTP